MVQKELSIIIQELIGQCSKLIPEYMKNPIDKSIANGNVAICIIDEEGTIYGKIWGTDKVRGRQSYKVAYIKCSQVWITGLNTGEFEKKIYNDEIAEETFGISKPDFIGWEGGQPIALKDGRKLSVGFSGFRGNYDLEIVTKALQELNY